MVKLRSVAYERLGIRFYKLKSSQKWKYLDIQRYLGKNRKEIMRIVQ
jgi:hypothetical protein